MMNNPAPSHPQVAQLVATLPPLPSAIRYFDDFFDTWRSIRHPDSLEQWPITTDGETHIIDFSIFGELSLLMKHLVLWQFGKLDPTTIALRFHASRRLPKVRRDRFLAAMLLLKPFEFRIAWVQETISLSVPEIELLKSFLHAMCDLHLGKWAPDYHDYVAKLPVPSADRYRSVRTGDCFVPLDQQSLLIDYFDDLSQETEADRLGDEELRDVCILVIVFQHAFRPGQIARLKTSDIRLYNTGAIHFSMVLTKKRGRDRGHRVTRRIKREWCSLFVEYSRRRSHLNFDADVPEDSYFGLTPAGVSRSVLRGTERLTGERWTATDLRHTAAQRQVDAGAPHIMISEFLGHSSLDTANVYFDTSSTQAQRVNQALAISPIFGEVAKVARTKTIDKAALLGLPPDQQIGGVPHGIPIAGIGGCAIGQSLCVKNPVLSCYTCRKFMPVSDSAVHRHVAEELRPVVLEFAQASRDNTESPAYTQLRRMLTAVEAVVAGIEEPDANE